MGRKNFAVTGLWSGEADLQPGVGVGDVPGLGRPGCRRLDDLEAAREQVAEPVGRGRRAEAETASELTKTSLAWGRTLKSPPKISGEVAAQSDAISAPASSSSSAAVGLVLTWTFPTQRPELEAGQRHHAQLGAPGQRHAAPLGDLARPRSHESGVRAALPGAEQVGAPAADQRGQRLQPVAAAQRAVGVGLAGARHVALPARRELLEKRHVPVDCGDHLGELVDQVPVDLLVFGAPARAAPEVALVGADLELRLRWPIPPMEDVPGHCLQLHARSIGGFVSAHFLTGEELSPGALATLLERAAELKKGRPGEGAGALAGRSVALVFERPSTRTRISFEVGVAELGGTPVVLRGDELQISRGESVGDTGRVLSRYVHAIAVRSGSHAALVELAEAAEVPVINALTPAHHPCQALADLLTLRERFGSLEGLKLLYVGDGNNVARSLAILGKIAGVEVVVAAPDGYRLEDELGVEQTTDPFAAADDADALYTDVWVSMGDEAEAADPNAKAILATGEFGPGVPFADVAKPKPGSWPTYNGDMSGNRFSPLNQINTANVQGLAPQWIFPIPSAPRPLQITPVVVDGVMYVTSVNEVYALDARNGREIWHYSRRARQGLAGDAASGINRGVAVLGDRVFFVTDNAHLFALHRLTGQLIWDVDMADSRQNYGATARRWW